MTYLSLAVIILALITAFAFGLVTGESLSIEQWKEEEDDEHPGDDR